MNLRKYNLALPEELFTELQTLAQNQHTSIADLLRRFIKLGLIASKIDQAPGSTLLIKQGDEEREIILF
jgi:hypothetical protein